MTLCTEDEARERWCPFARHDSSAGGSHNRDYQGGPATMCLASQCMQWRWWDIVDKDGNAYYCEAWGARTPAELSGPIETRRGYCGRAGKP